MSVGSWVKRTPSPRSRSYSRPDVVDGERGERDAVGDQRLLERLGRRVFVGFEEELGAVRIVGRHDGDPPMLTQRDVGLLA